MSWDWQQSVREHPTMGAWYERYRSRPSWVTRGALIAGVLVVVVPLVLLTLAAVFVGLLAFFILAAAAWTVNLLGRLGASRDDGRRNVRIIQR